MDLPVQDACCFKLAQMLGKHSLRYQGYESAQFVEAAGTGHHMVQDKRLPLSSNCRQRHLDGAVIWVGADGINFHTRFQNPALFSDRLGDGITPAS